MTAHQAASAWQKRQTQLLARTYTRAWNQGAAAYRAQHATPSAARLTSAPPTKPNAAAMSRALAPALSSLARMAAQIATLIPTAAMLAAAGTIAGATLLAAQAYLQTNGWLLAAGASVAWAGEMAGYAESAAADGMLIAWELDPLAQHCEDCPLLAGLPPMPLEWWPTLPGEGATECNVGCRCSLRAVAAKPPVLTGAQHELISRIANRQPVLIAA